MSNPDVAYYGVRSGSKVLGRHCLMYPNGLPPYVSKPLLGRNYKDYPDAVIERDPDQESTATGIYTRKPTPGRYLYQRKFHTALAAAAKYLSRADILAIVDELVPE